MGIICPKCQKRNQSSRKKCQFCNWDLNTTYEVVPVKKEIPYKRNPKDIANGIAEIALKARDKIEKQNRENRESTETVKDTSKLFGVRIGKVHINVNGITAEDVELGIRNQVREVKKIRYK